MRMKANSEKVEELVKMRTPTNINQLRSAPLTAQLNKTNNALRIMGNEDIIKPVQLHMDACKSGFTAILT